MAQYTAKDLRNITKDELGELLTKEGISFDPKMPYFAMRALLLNKDEKNENENEETMGKKKTEPVIENDNEAVKTVENPVDGVEQSEQTEPEQTEEAEPKQTEQVKVEESEKKPSVSNINALAALRGELVRRKGGVGFGKSAFAAELAKRRGERVVGNTFAQELKSRQLKYGK